MDILKDAAARAEQYLRSVNDRSVAATAQALNDLNQFEYDLPVDGQAPAEVLAQLDRWGSPATVATNGSRFFGFVIGGALPVTMASSWLATAWAGRARRSMRSLNKCASVG